MAIAEAAHSISTSCTFLTQTLGNDLRDLKTGELCSKMRHQARVDAQISLTSTLYVNADFVLQSLFLDASLAKRFQRLEELRTPLNPDPPIQGEYESRDVAPLAGRLVMYDSVAVPHEVLAVCLPRLIFFFLLDVTQSIKF